MELIEKYNETYSKSLITKLYRDKKATISYDEIYDLLGRYHDPDHARLYCQTGSEADFKKNLPVMPFPQRHKEIRDDYIDSLVEYLHQGRYFHYRFDYAENKNERMIINMNNQLNAMKVIKHLYSNPGNRIGTMKFFARTKIEAKELKCDKIVIYYNKRFRNDIFNQVINAGVAENAFLPHLSAFYHVAAADSRKAYTVGVGMEIPGTSFTTENSKLIFRYLTGNEYDADHRKDQYPARYKGDEGTFVTDLYTDCVGNLDIF